jgi:spore coat polysaccharide biosynthesis protein SpsF
MKIVAIIQARMGSRRLPGKVLADVCGKPLLHYVVCRVRQSRTLSLFAVATSDHSTDDVIEMFCQTNVVPCFRGSQDDVLDRYYHAAKHFQANVIVRLTADCPLLDPVIIDDVVQTFLSGEFDYVSSAPNYPDGLDTEVFTLKALKQAWQEARLPSEREHVTPYITKNPGRFRVGSVKNDQDLSHMRWTVDEPQDLELVRQIYQRLLDKPIFGMADILALFQQHPDLYAINAGFSRNEGYQKSLREDESKRKAI